MSFDWFGTKNSGELQFFSVGRSAWEALDYISIVLLIAILAALALAVLRLMDAVPDFPFSANAVVAGLGIASALLILYRIVNPPDFGSFREFWGTFTIEGTVQSPIYLGLCAAAGIAVGGFLVIREEA